MSLPPTTGGSAFSDLASVVGQIGATVRRDQAYAAAAAADKIGADFEAIKVLVDQLRRDLAALPDPSDIAKATGASTGEAAIFAVPLMQVMAAARQGALDIQGEVDDVANAVLLTLKELSASDATGESILASNRDALDAMASEAATPTNGVASSATIVSRPTPSSGLASGRGPQG